MEIFKKRVKEWEKGGRGFPKKWEVGFWGGYLFSLDVHSPSFKCFETLDVLFGIVCAEK